MNEEAVALLKLSSSQIMELLDASKWLDGFAIGQVERVADFFKAFQVGTGTVLIEEGKTPGFFALVCEGEVNVLKENSAGEEKILQVFGPGKIFGEMSFVDQGASSARVVAKCDTLLLLMTRDRFEKMCAESPMLGLQLIMLLFCTLSQRLRQTSGRLIDLL